MKAVSAAVKLIFALSVCHSNSQRANILERNRNDCLLRYQIPIFTQAFETASDSCSSVLRDDCLSSLPLSKAHR